MKKDIVFTLNSLNVRLDPLLLVVLIAMHVAGLLNEFTMAFASIFLHEMGHVSAACIMGKKVFSVRILPVGLNAVIEEDIYNNWRQMAVYLSGPAVNILIFAASLLIDLCCLLQSDNLQFFISINMYLFAFNLMPILPLDGGKILKSLITSRLGLIKADKYIRRISWALSAVLLTAGILQLYRSMRNFSLVLISTYIFFTLKSGELEAALMNVKNIIYRHSRLLKKGIYQARDLVALKTISLSEILKRMDYDRFHLVYVLDEDLKLIRVFTEQEIIDAMFKYNSDMSFQELIAKEIANNNI